MHRILFVALVGLPAVARAQMPSRPVMVEDWEHTRKRTIAFLDAAPDSMLSFRTTTGVRTFAEQINHIASAAVYIAAMAVKGDKQPPAVLMGDSAVYLHNKDALRDRTNKLFDWVEGTIQGMSDADLAAITDLLGFSRPRYRWNAMVLEHSAFTLGQTVPYLRMNNITPPTYLPF
jgi:hypothetical protein